MNRASVVGGRSPAPHPWTRVLDRSRAAYGRALERRVAARRTERRVTDTDAVAVVTPLPPSQTGIASYSLRLLEAMAERRIVRAYADGRDGAAAADVSARLQAYPVGEYPRRERDGTDRPRRLMCFGNSHFHVAAWQLLMEYGGDVLLHEISLCGLYLTLDSRGLLGPGGIEARARTLEDCSLEDALAEPCAMVTEVVDKARRVFVHTERARSLLIERRPERERDISVVRFALPAPRPPAHRRGDPIVASFGYMRAPEQVIEAFAEIVAACPAARLWLVGAEHRSGQMDQLVRAVSEHGIAERVLFTGWVGDAEYRRRLEATTVAIQPRTRDYGERSSALGDLLAAGVPTVVNDAGSASEIPREAVVHVDSGAGSRALATAALALLRDPEQRSRISEAARRYAGEHSAARAAEELLGLMDDDGARPAGVGNVVAGRV